MSQPAKSLNEIREIIERVSFKDRSFVLLTPDSGELFLQMQYWDTCVDTGLPEKQHCRKWRISRYMTTSEIVQTCFKAVITSQEHIAREFFEYRGEAVFCPHYDVEQLVELCRSGKQLDAREPNDSWAAKT